MEIKKLLLIASNCRKSFLNFKIVCEYNLHPMNMRTSVFKVWSSIVKNLVFPTLSFLTAGEEFFLGHVTLDEIKPWVDVIKQATKVLRENNIGVSLHHWIGFGHLDRGIGLKPNQNFKTMVDFNGKQSISVACPLDKNWQTHFRALLGYLVKEVQPDYYWVEDDFRLHNHAPLY